VRVDAGVDDIWSEDVSDFAYVVGLDFFFLERSAEFEVKIEEVLGLIILIHSDVFELKFDLDVIIGQEGAKLDELISEIFNELIIYIADPGLQLDRYILEE
jgi:hypothetical protein